MKRHIRRVAVLGSGVMGSRIACHIAGAGIPVLLLDRPAEIPEGKSPNATLRNQLVNDALAAAVKSNPSPLFTKSALTKITTGNLEDNLSELSTVDWIIEVVVERLDIKNQLWEKVEQYRKPGTLVTSNTSGIPIHLMAQGRSDDFKKHFCGTHFFNPPRYLRLLEIIPTTYTNPEVIDFLMEFGDLVLGKTTVLCKDTPAFIANRIGVYSIFSTFHLMEKLKLGIDDIDALTGTVFGRPKSATFRTADVVGIDTLVKVAKGVAEHCPNDEAKAVFQIPGWLQQMVDTNKLGDKTGEGFFKKMKTADGQKEIQTLDLTTMTYQPRRKPKFASLESAKPVEDLKQRLVMLQKAPDQAGAFYRAFHYGLFSYIAHRIPEISDELYRVDDAMMAGFGWEIGAFESWDLFGVASTVETMQKEGYQVPEWIKDMLKAGHTSFYKIENGHRSCYDPIARSYKGIPGSASFLIMKHREKQLVWKNSACRAYDLGDEVLGLEWNTKMNSIGGEVLEGINKSVAIAEEKFKGLVIANEGPNFSAGANVGMIFMLAMEQEYEELDMAIRLFQNTVMRIRYSAVPVAIAQHGLTLGGACEMSLHADACLPAAETYIGLVELGVGLIPGGGGTKEFVLRASDDMHDDEPETITLKNRFLAIATAKVATSAHEGFELGVFRKGTDHVVMNPLRRIAAAKQKVLELSAQGYTMPVQRQDIRVLGQSALGALYAGVHGMWRAGYATDHDVLVAKKLAYVMCGGDLSAPTLVNEQYLLDLEREAFLSLTGEKKTLERIQSVLKGGKPLRN